jgi:hypothetical protein
MRSDGVHLGDVSEKADGDLYGDGVIAARLQALAERAESSCRGRARCRQESGRREFDDRGRNS